MESVQQSAIDALESFVVDNEDLERLEVLLSDFNLFEALGAVRQELRHSCFLSFLLNPRERHGLGDEFVRRVLQCVVADAIQGSIQINRIDLDIWDLHRIDVYREWNNIDLLLIDQANGFGVVIENKIDSTEHSNQLERYLEIAKQQFPSLKIFGVYLTPAGETPSHQSYTALSYSSLSIILERMADSRASTIGSDVQTLLRHYTQMLRRHIVEETEIAKLCKRIYEKHKTALDLIFEHRLDQQAWIREVLEGLIQEQPSLALDHTSKSYVRFGIKQLDIPTLMVGEGWTPSGRILVFEFTNSPERLSLALYIGPGPALTRQRLFEMAQQTGAPFRTPSKSLKQKWNMIYNKNFLTARDYEESSNDEIEQKIRTLWYEFVTNDLKRITEVVSKQSWFS